MPSSKLYFAFYWIVNLNNCKLSWALAFVSLFHFFVCSRKLIPKFPKQKQTIFTFSVFGRNHSALKICEIPYPPDEIFHFGNNFFFLKRGIEKWWTAMK